MSDELDKNILEMVGKDPEVIADPMAEHLGVGKRAAVVAIRRLRIGESPSRKGRSRDR